MTYFKKHPFKSYKIHSLSNSIISQSSFSIASETCDGHSRILSAVDSIEVISRRTSSSQPVFESNSPQSIERVESITSIKSQESSTEDNSRMPPYMKVPPYRCGNFEKMTEEEWLQLQVKEDMKDSRRKSSIQFDIPPRRTSSKRSSILKSTARTSSTVSNDALPLIREKCLEAAAGMKVETILRKMCEDNDAEHPLQPSSGCCSARGQNQ